MKAVICDICGKVIRPQIKPNVGKIVDYETIQFKNMYFETCTECCDEIQHFIKILQTQGNKKGE